jgi:hypothetical protein
MARKMGKSSRGKTRNAGSVNRASDRALQNIK